jgi:hypothetical protein
MQKKNLSPSLDEALAQVNPERRRLLGMLLAGAAALPLISTTSLAQDDKTQYKESSAIKHDAQGKGVQPDAKNAWPTSKTGSAIKSNNIKYSPQTIKLTNADKSSSIKSDYVKGGSSANIKSSSTAIKSDYVKGGSSIKASSSQVKSSNAPQKNTPNQ